MAIENLEQFENELAKLIDELECTLYILGSELQEFNCIFERFKDLHTQLTELRSQQEV